MNTRLLILTGVVFACFLGSAFALESEKTKLHIFDYLDDKPIAYIIDYDMEGYLRNAVVDFDTNTVIFEIKDSGVLTVEIPKTHFLPDDYYPALLIDKKDKDPIEFLTKDEECFKEYRFSVSQSTMIELVMDKSDDSSIVNDKILANCQDKIDDEITNTFDFNTVFEDGLEYTIVDGKKYLSKTIKSSLARLTHDKTIFELSGMKFHFHDKSEDTSRIPGMGIMGLRTPVLFEFPDGATKEMFIKTIPTPQDMSNEQYIDIEIYARPNWPEIGIVAGLTPSNQITKLLVFEKNISPYKQLQYGIKLKNISCKAGLELIQKRDSSSACVKEQSIPKMIERGWVKDFTHTSIVSALKSVEFDKNPIEGDVHYDRVDRNKKYWATLKDIKLLDDESIEITFADNDYQIKQRVNDQPVQTFEIPDFEYVSVIKEGQTFVPLCTETSEKRLHVLKYAGIMQKNGTDYFTFWHKSAVVNDFPECKYPDIIQYSLDVDFDLGNEPPISPVWDHDWE